MEAVHKKDGQAEKASTFTEYDYSNFYYGAGDDPLNLLAAVRRLVRRGAAERLLPLLRAACTPRPSPRSRSRTARRARLINLLNLASYNYLGISYRPEVKEAANDALDKYGLGASGSPILSGTMDVHDELGQAARRVQGQGSRDRLPDRLQRERRASSPRSCARATRSSSTSTRTRRSWTARSWPSRRRPSSATTTRSTSSGSSRASRARSWSWSRASTRWTATSACCPRSSRSPSATARAS